MGYFKWDNKGSALLQGGDFLMYKRIWDSKKRLCSLEFSR